MSDVKLNRYSLAQSKQRPRSKAAGDSCDPTRTSSQELRDQFLMKLIGGQNRFTQNTNCHLQLEAGVTALSYFFIPPSFPSGAKHGC